MKAFKKISIIIAAMACIMVLSNTTWATDVKKVNINTATVEELVSLDGIGEKYAEKIINYREKNGNFKIPEDILNVKGIGEKTFEKNKNVIITENKVKTN